MPHEREPGPVAESRTSARRRPIAVNARMAARRPPGSSGTPTDVCVNETCPPPPDCDDPARREKTRSARRPGTLLYQKLRIWQQQGKGRQCSSTLQDLAAKALTSNTRIHGYPRSRGSTLGPAPPRRQHRPRHEARGTGEGWPALSLPNQPRVPGHGRVPGSVPAPRPGERLWQRGIYSSQPARSS